jgi:hypothetical protein
MKKVRWTLVILLIVSSVVFAQRRGRFGGGGRGWGGESWVSEDARTAREVDSHSTGTPNWTNASGFERDVFTFVRIKRDQSPDGSGGSWRTDTPDSDLNLSYRLQQMTALKVDPNGRYLRLTEKELRDYPFIYMVEPGSLYLADDEAKALREYLSNGGFLWLDDFWGEREWQNMADELAKAFPGRPWVELDLSHPLYHCVFNIKEKSQVPSINAFYSGRTSERYDSAQVHHRALFDDKGRMMALATHNTDNGDGWEREGENRQYFEECSEKTAYPLAINVVFYIMTH